MATSPFLPLPTGLEIAGTCASASTLTVSVVSTVSSAPCPLCHTEATRIHSRYQRTLADLPCGGQRVILLLIVRRFVCEVPTCPRRIFDPAIALARASVGADDRAPAPGISIPGAGDLWRGGSATGAQAGHAGLADHSVAVDHGRPHASCWSRRTSRH
jgi:transposase